MDLKEGSSTRFFRRADNGRTLLYCLIGAAGVWGLVQSAALLPHQVRTNTEEIKEHRAHVDLVVKEMRDQSQKNRDVITRLDSNMQNLTKILDKLETRLP